MKDDKPPQSPQLNEVTLGENKALHKVLFKGTKFGVIVFLPSSHDPATKKTFFKPLAIVVDITQAQRDEIIKLLGGTPPCN